MNNTTLDCPPLPDGEARDAMIEELEKKLKESNRQLFSAREKAAKWKRRYDELKNHFGDYNKKVEK